MWNSVLLALFLLCAGIVTICSIYVCLLWLAAAFNNNNQPEHQSTVKPMKEKGISAADLEKLPRITGRDLGLATECAVCIDDIGSDQPVRLMPRCNHGFHLQCADKWLSKQSICPVCRTKLQPEFFNLSETSSS